MICIAYYSRVGNSRNGYRVWYWSTCIALIVFFLDSQRFNVVGMLSTLSQYVIPRKATVQQSEEIKEDEFRFIEVPSTSERFKEVFAPVITNRLSPYGSNKSSVKIVNCYSVANPRLEKKFESFRSKLSADGVSSEASYAFMVVGDNAQEVDIIAKDSLWTGNVAVGDLGTPRKGVYLSESPDLTTPAPFVDETTTLRIFAFK
ncbi:unnamed protein product, partial [Enterobius vermicularis]|uniref:Oxidored_molyb domain-containing protein n=1 Tax=Enterobius vermicularis TaxID=51028 RepID=A0A0N4VFM6_ENTVE